MFPNHKPHLWICSGLIASWGGIAAAGITSHFSFDGNANNSVSGQAAGTEFGSVNYVAGKFGQAASLNAVNDTINLNTTTGGGAVGTGNFSISLWINADAVTSIGSDPAFFSSKPWGGSGHANNNGFVYSINSGNDLDIHTVSNNPSTFDRNDWDAGAGGGEPSLSAGWNNLVIVRSGTNLTFYLNGSQIGNSYTDLTANANFATAFQNFMVGDSTTTSGGSPAQGDYNGNPNWNNDILIDDLTFYDEAINSTEIARLQTEQAFDPPAPPVTHAGAYVATDAEACDRFADALAVDRTSNRLLIGAPMEDANGDGSGAVYIYNLIDGSQTFKLAASDAAAGDSLGQAVALSPSFAVASAPSDTDNGADSGSVYVFDPKTGNQLRKLTPNDGEAGDLFGWSIAISGNEVAIGAPGDDDQGTDAGAVYLFDLTTGAQIRKTLPPASSDEDWFGFSVSFSNGKIAAGALNDDDGGTDAGAAYLMDASNGTQSGKLTASDAAADDWFGYAVSLRTDTALIGAPHEDKKGAVYLFNTSTNAQTQKTSANDAAPDDLFGFSVSFDDDYYLIGATTDTNGEGNQAGAAYLYRRSDHSLVEKTLHTDQLAGDFMGMAVALSEDAMVAGAPIADSGATTEAGAIFISFINPPVTDDAYTDWITAYGLTGNDALETADPNSDGLNNLASYAFNILPGSSGFWPKAYTAPTASVINSGADTGIHFELPRIERPDVRYIIEQSTTLQSASWTTIKTKDGTGDWMGSATVAESMNLDGSTSVTVTSTLPLSSNGRAFMRIRIELLP